MSRWLLAVVLCLLAGTVHAWNGPVDTVAGITLRIEGPAEIATADPFPMAIVLENTTTAAVSISLAAQGIDGWSVGMAESPVDVGPGVPVRIEVEVQPAASNYAATYPVHVYGTFMIEGREHVLHPVLMVNVLNASADVQAQRRVAQSFDLPANKQLSLLDLPQRQAALVPFDAPAIELPAGWQGTHEQTGAVVSLVPQAEVTVPRRALALHIPWRDQYPGLLRLDYPIRLPHVTPIKLRFGIASRITPENSGADGVVIRVKALAVTNGHSASNEAKILAEAHSAAPEWQAVEADLSEFAGQSILLQIEEDPGPARNTAYDLAYLADAVLVAGELPAKSDPGDLIALGTIESSGGPIEAGVRLGRCGVLDGRVEFQSGSGMLYFDGFDLRVLGEPLGAYSALNALESVEILADAPLTVRHTFRNQRGSFALTARLWVEENKALRTAFTLDDAPPPEPWSVVKIDNISLGPWSEVPNRLYAGVGNVLVEPEAFELGMDGHRLSTSFVGADFGGISLVQGIDTPPDKLAFRPAERQWSLHAPLDQVRTFIPASTAWEGAKVWRELDSRKAAPGVGRLAGRFVFDLWGGHYGPSADAMQNAIDYGLFYSAVVWHNWQRWGYDYRLPDIWPPNPDFGTLEEFQRLAKVCMSNGLLFAPHDNYIDFYPDAAGFSYDRIAFNQQGEPIKGWWNWGREAQAWRWATDAVFPFLRENVEAIKDGIAPNSYFIDVWSSIGPYDSWTADGMFVDRIHTRNEWGRSFAWIRDTLGNAAPQISESGHDQLVGWLDGAQVNHLRVDTNPAKDAEWMVWKIACADAERIPWIDMAYHDRFVLHGAGYEPRYAAGLDLEQHGIYRDDYMSTEVLTGHPAMVKEAFSRNVVRKYWLLGPLGMRLAGKKIEGVAFVDGDIHRQHVSWQGGGEVWVNRGASIWTVGEHILPQYGFYAEAGSLRLAIEKTDYGRLEWCQIPGFFYAQPRPQEGSTATADFGWVSTTGGCRIAADNQKVVVTPLPESATFTLRFRPNQWPKDLPDFPGRRWEAVNKKGEVLEAGPMTQEGEDFVLVCKPEVFAYRVL